LDLRRDESGHVGGECLEVGHLKENSSLLRLVARGEGEGRKGRKLTFIVPFLPSFLPSFNDQLLASSLLCSSNLLRSLSSFTSLPPHPIEPLKGITSSPSFPSSESPSSFSFPPSSTLHPSHEDPSRSWNDTRSEHMRRDPSVSLLLGKRC